MAGAPAVRYRGDSVRGRQHMIRHPLDDILVRYVRRCRRTSRSMLEVEAGRHGYDRVALHNASRRLIDRDELTTEVEHTKGYNRGTFIHFVLPH